MFRVSGSPSLMVSKLVHLKYFRTQHFRQIHSFKGKTKRNVFGINLFNAVLKLT